MTEPASKNPIPVENSYPRWSILLVEDDEEDYLITRSTLAEIPHRKIAVEWASSFDAGLHALEKGSFDTLLVDYGLGGHTGLDLISQAAAQGFPAPMILLTGHDSYELDLQAMRAGATDFLSKGAITPALLERSIRYAIERKQIEQSLIHVNEQLVQATEELEDRVRARTEELMAKNKALIAQIEQRISLEMELAEVQRRLLDRTESDRLELAQELHDGAMQDLYALTYEMVSLSDCLVDEDSQAQIAGISAHIQQIIATLRTIAGELRPPALAPFGLEKAIRSHVETFQPSHKDLKINLDLISDGQALPERTRLVLFRIYQMALTNIVRHARATEATIRLAMDPNTVELEIGDNGRGFVLPPRWYEFAREGHLGLAGAAERAEAVGGTLHVDTAPGKGTRVRVTVPR